MQKNIKIEKKVHISIDDDLLFEAKTASSGTNSMRIDSFLIKKFPDLSRSYFQKLISVDLVTVNESSVNKSFLVKLGDKIQVSFPVPQRPDLVPMDLDFEIVGTDKDFIIINKPSGLIVHRTNRGELSFDEPEPTLVNGLLYRFNDFSEFDDNERPGIVHRIDKNTSGLMIVARNIKSQIGLSKLFRDRLVNKAYLAVVKGHPDPEGKIDFPVGRHPVDRKKMSHVSYEGRPALTYYKVLKYYDESSLVSVKIVTGRTHQIRVHFAALGHGILGDDLYGVKSKFIKRQALHSWKLAFEFNGNKFDYLCTVPEDFRRLISILS
jgi:23S rRNA pseudouridine1911/1915/1917 synthase